MKVFEKGLTMDKGDDYVLGYIVDCLDFDTKVVLRHVSKDWRRVIGDIVLMGRNKGNIKLHDALVMQPNDVLWLGGNNGSLLLVRYGIKRGAIDVDNGLLCACQCGNLDCIKMLIDMKGKLSFGFKGACVAGNIGVIEFLIQRGCDNWDDGLECACYGGHLEIAKYMIKKGADDLIRGLVGACCSGSLGIVKMLVESCKISAYGLNKSMAHAAGNGYLNVVEYLVEKGSNDWNWGLSCACFGRHKKIMMMMIKKGATKCKTCDKTLAEHKKICESND